ncbi:receptor-like protein 33 isoform X2 [Pistacia vera]|uniref:receptor-like protein 33 isoform X1 n=1 Tax=Pistacia vera TaxID=55513 RepID=UPI001263D1E0|nr:receptor-like protein 33 isoform X1 [Pistacia vera]XP_031252291.1 receptor-like protein 33 isoform X2 [Pistacia vera]
MWSLSWHNLLPCLLFMYLNFQVIFSLPINSSSPSAKLCSPEQRLALLHFKSTFTIHKNNHSCEEHSYPKTYSWKESTDCCSWDGVTCDSFTGQVIGLDLSSSWIRGAVFDNSSLFLLHHLRKLNLACNDLSGSTISSKFGQFMKLTHLNLSFSGFYGLIPTEIYHLAELVSIDLSVKFGDRLPELSQHVFNKQLQNLTKLRHLHLDGVNMSSVAPGSLVNLSSTLISLVISNTSLQGDFPEDIFRFPFLQKLSLTGNGNLTGTLPKYNWSSSLRLLDLSETSFSGKLPDTIGNLINLNVLDLSLTSFSGKLPDTIGNLIYLNVLDLSFTIFSGKLPDKIGNLGYLNVLDLSDSEFEGSIPKSLWNCMKIISLDLSFNRFNGQVAASLSKLSQLTSLNLRGNNFEGKFPDVFGNLGELTDLDLSLNNFSGQLPSSAFNLSHLSVLDFSENQVEGHIPFQVSGLSNLISLKMSNNFLAGRVPSWLFTLPSLETLDLSDNKLTGPIEEFHPPGSVKNVYLMNNEIQGSIPNSMFELSKLRTLDLSYNTLLSFVNQKNETFTFPSLQRFSCSSCNITEFPNFLRTSKTLKILDLSNNRIHGQIIQWEFELFHNLYYLNLSHNFLTSFFPSGKTSNMNLVVLDLHSNFLEGPLVILDAPGMDTLLLSDNMLTGEISSSICNLSCIHYLDLSLNRLSGTIPQCLGNASMLSLLNLEMNNFSGNVPTITAYSYMHYLNLNDNKLEGSLPPTLVNCSYLEVLNVGNNMINDTFPHWLAKLPKLQVLILRSNRFHGSIGISMGRLSFPKLRIIDISHNHFTGALPTRFYEKFNMMGGEILKGELKYLELLDNRGAPQNCRLRPSYVLYYSIVLTMKGVDREIDRILNIFTMMDLSNNQFEGQIPKAIGKLNYLQGLNLSHNNLTGHIPPLLENLTQLESLDFSFNNFVGKIPNQLTNLSFLSVLNLSYNQLVGSIPQGNQFYTFQNDSYIGNFGLCGSPLSRKCIRDEPPSPVPSIYHEEDDESSWFDWKIALMGYGCGLVLGLSIGYIVFTTRKPQWFVRKIERVSLRNMRKVEKRSPRRRN